MKLVVFMKGRGLGLRGSERVVDGGFEDD